MSLNQLPEASNEEVILSGPQEEVITDNDFLAGVYDAVPLPGQHQVIGEGERERQVVLMTFVASSRSKSSKKY